VSADSSATIGTVATAQSQNGQQGDPTIPVTVTFDDPNSAPNLDQAPVKVRVTTNAARGVLAVPVGALLALSGGGYVVERLTGEGITEQVPVKLGAFADNYVQVTGNIKAKFVIVEGRVDGDIYASESVSIRQSAKVKGNIFAPRVGIADGANFSGSIDMNHKGAAATQRPATVQVALSDPAAERLLTKAAG